MGRSMSALACSLQLLYGCLCMSALSDLEGVSFSGFRLTLHAHFALRNERLIIRIAAVSDDSVVFPVVLPSVMTAA